MTNDNTKVSGVYEIQNTNNGKRYIGASNNIYKRFTEHKGLLFKNKHPNAHLQRAWNLYGENSFSFQIIEKCDRESLIHREQHYIDSWKPEYNIALFSNAPMKGRTLSDKVREILRACATGNTYNKGRKHSEQTRQRMSQAHIGNKSRLGTSTSEQGKKNISESIMGRHVSDETKRKHSENMKGNKFALGYKHSKEFGEKVRERLLGKKRPPMTEEQKIKISNSLKGNIPWNKGKKKNADG